MIEQDIRRAIKAAENDDNRWLAAKLKLMLSDIQNDQAPVTGNGRVKIHRVKSAFTGMTEAGKLNPYTVGLK